MVTIVSTLLILLTVVKIQAISIKLCEFSLFSNEFMPKNYVI